MGNPGGKPKFFNVVYWHVEDAEWRYYTEQTYTEQQKDAVLARIPNQLKFLYDVREVDIELYIQTMMTVNTMQMTENLVGIPVQGYLIMFRGQWVLDEYGQWATESQKKSFPEGDGFYFIHNNGTLVFFGDNHDDAVNYAKGTSITNN